MNLRKRSSDIKGHDIVMHDPVYPVFNSRISLITNLKGISHGDTLNQLPVTIFTVTIFTASVLNNSSQIVNSSIEKNNVTVPLERTIKLDHIAPCIKF